MQRALPGSVLVHALVLGVALVGFSWSESDDAPAAEAVSVSIVAVSTVASNATELIQSDATESLVSSGAKTSAPPVVQPIEPETVAARTESVSPLLPAPQQAVSEPAVEPVAAEAIEAEEPLSPEPIVAETAILTASTSVIEPVSSADLKVAPIPQTLSLQRTSRPTYPKPEQQQPRQQQPAPQPSQAGNGGANNADAVAAAGGAVQQASAGSGGEAEIARYPSEVLRKLRRVLRSSNGQSGEVVVRFTVLANGSVAGISIGRSSGNAAVDQAGVATVNRAAPFPPIPAAANRSDWTFDVPLEFRG
jgi:periplasmic protein TonB